MGLVTGQVAPEKDRVSGRALSDSLASDKGGGLSIRYRLSPRRSLLWLGILTLALHFVGAAGRGLEYLLGYKGTTEFVRLFHVGEEGNVATWFSVMLLMFSSILLAIIASLVKARSKPYVWHWTMLSVVFFLMSVDAAARIQELAMGPLRSQLGATGAVQYASVLPAVALVIVLAVAYWGFVRHLPRDTRRLFLASGGLFIFGAVGMDMLAGYFALSDAGPGWMGSAFTTVEVLLENVSIVAFIYALLSHLGSDLQVSEILVEIDGPLGKSTDGV